MIQWELHDSVDQQLVAVSNTEPANIKGLRAMRGCLLDADNCNKVSGLAIGKAEDIPPPPNPTRLDMDTATVKPRVMDTPLQWTPLIMDSVWAYQSFLLLKEPLCSGHPATLDNGYFLWAQTVKTVNFNPA